MAAEYNCTALHYMLSVSLQVHTKWLSITHVKYWFVLLENINNGLNVHVFCQPFSLQLIMHETQAIANVQLLLITT